ncbi:MAG: ATP-binding cassette domain-containing protein [Gemmatimonadota bacterium]
MITVDSVTKRYGPLKAVDDISFQIDPGEVVGFLGPNGAGKTTTMKILTGSLQPDEGDVSYDGVSIGEDVTGARKRVGYLPETNALYPEMLVSEYLTWAGELRSITGGALRRALPEVVERTGVGPVFTRPVSQLSKGFRQRVGLAAAILHEPEILVLDEPTEGLDPNQRVGIRELIRELGRERTVILSTHVLGEVEATCDRLLIIRKGKLVADGSVASLVEGQLAGPSYVVEARGDGVEETLAGLPGVTGHETAPVQGRIRVRLASDGSEDLRPVIFETAAEKGWTLWELHRERASLEDLFRTVTEDEYEAGISPPARPGASGGTGSTAADEGVGTGSAAAAGGASGSSIAESDEQAAEEGAAEEEEAR